MNKTKEKHLAVKNNVTICAVTKGQSVAAVEELLAKNPQIKIIAENRWPDCEEKFKHFTELEKHFVGPLQTNKVRKVVPLTDVIQSVDSRKLLEKIDSAAKEFNKVVQFCIQVNVSGDPQKSGLYENEVFPFIAWYLKQNLKNVKLVGLMTIGQQTDLDERAKYFARLKKLFYEINEKCFKQNPLKILSMGMSEDYKIAIQNGATMVRLGTVLFLS